MNIALEIVIAWLVIIFLKSSYKAIRKFGVIGWKASRNIFKTGFYFIKAILEEVDRELRK